MFGIQSLSIFQSLFKKTPLLFDLTSVNSETIFNLRVNLRIFYSDLFPHF